MPPAEAVVEELLPCDARRLGTIKRGQFPRIFVGGGAHTTTGGPSATQRLSSTRTVALNEDATKCCTVSNHVPGTCESNTHVNAPGTQMDIDSAWSLSVGSPRGKVVFSMPLFLRSPDACECMRFCGIAGMGAPGREAQCANTLPKT